MCSRLSSALRRYVRPLAMKGALPTGSNSPTRLTKRSVLRRRERSHSSGPFSKASDRLNGESF